MMGVGLPRFGGILQARYRVMVQNAQGTSKPEQLKLYQLDARDLPLVDGLLSHLKKQKWFDYSLSDNIKEGLRRYIVEMMLTDTRLLWDVMNQQRVSFPMGIFMAVVNEQPCGMIMVNMPKLTRDLRLTGSSRDRANETEIDWIATWPIVTGQVKGAGKLLLSHAIEFCQQQGLKDLFVRAANKHQSDSISFYEAMGFKADEPMRPSEKVSSPRDLAMLFYNHRFVANRAWILPMKLSLAEATSHLQQIYAQFQQKRLKPRFVSPQRIAPEFMV